MKILRTLYQTKNYFYKIYRLLVDQHTHHQVKSVGFRNVNSCHFALIVGKFAAKKKSSNQLTCYKILLNVYNLFTCKYMI